MENIHEILKSYGLDIPVDKKEEFDKKVAENYKTVVEVSNVKSKLEKAETERDTYKTKYEEDIKQRDADIEDLKKKLETAGTDETKLSELQTQLSTLQTTYDEDKAKYEKQLSEQAYKFAVEKKASEIKFSSNSAKKAFIADCMREEMKLKEGELQGFDSFLESYKENDADAFLKDDSDNKGGEGEGKTPKPQFSSKSGGKDDKPEDNKREHKENPVIW